MNKPAKLLSHLWIPLKRKSIMQQRTAVMFSHVDR